MARTPFKNLSSTGTNANAMPATKVSPSVPGKSPPTVNEKRGNVVPDGEKPIPWPDAPGTDHNPIEK